MLGAYAPPFDLVMEFLVGPPPLGPLRHRCWAQTVGTGKKERSRGSGACRHGSWKPAAWADEDAPCIAAALMARPPCDTLRKRPRKDALLEAERSHQRVAGLDEKLDEMLRCGELERRTDISAGGWAASTISSTEIASEPERSNTGGAAR